MELCETNESIDENVCKDMEIAVNVNNVVFEYRNGVNVLNHINVEVPKGQITALLGPNGCGKTTLIKAILGRIQLNSGSVNVFGVRPGSSQSDIPGPGVGYMPQDLALFNEMTIKEILTYYAMIYHLKGEEMMNRIENLIELLNLPEKSRPISRLSGKQQRRVSIAVTLIHRPKLIVMDEPTVGVDSLLRHKLWKYLNDICIKYGQTVIITTHYIEEAKSAANVAFMTSGSVLKQSNPQKLLQEYNCQTLEEVFLILCQQKVKGKQSDSLFITTDALNTSESNANLEDNNKEEIFSDNSDHNSYKSIDFMRIKAMLWKYFISTQRRPQFLIIYFLIPFMAFVFLKYSVDNYPFNTPIAVFNADTNPYYSEYIIDSIDRKYIKVNRYSDNKTAVESVIKGKNVIYMYFNPNYSESFGLKTEHLYDMSNEELSESEVKIYADFSNSVISLFAMTKIFLAFENSMFNIKHDLNYDLMTPLVIEKPIYGKIEFKFTNLIAPGLMIALTQSIIMSISALHILYDKQNSSFERIFVSGVKPMEFFVAHIIENILILILYVIFEIIIAFGVFGNTLMGNPIEVFIILMLQGIIGILFGLLLPIATSDTNTTVACILAMVFPSLLISGILWPVEAIPGYFRPISDYNHVTLPSNALRSIMYKGWTYNNTTVLSGYISSLIYIVIITLADIILFEKFI